MRKTKKPIANVEFGHEIFDINGSKMYDVTLNDLQSKNQREKKDKRRNNNS